MSVLATEPPADDAQAVVAPLTGAAIFVLLLAQPGDAAKARVRDTCADIPGLVRSVGTRDLDGNLTCVTGIGSDLWDRLVGSPRPAELHPFRAIDAGPRQAPATPADVLLHVRAKRMDLCFELVTQVVGRFGDAVRPVDEVQGFMYFDYRDVIGFVDGTENPAGDAAARAVLVGAEDPAFAQGSYVIVQKYFHDMTAWNALPIETQELVIGRTKLDNIEMDDDTKPPFAHTALAKVEENGVEIKILRDNMPFGTPSSGELGTYFIGYARSARTIETMLQKMFVGDPPGTYDRILDYSTARTGALFFVPPVSWLQDLSPRPA